MLVPLTILIYEYQIKEKYKKRNQKKQQFII